MSSKPRKERSKASGWRTWMIRDLPILILIYVAIQMWQSRHLPDHAIPPPLMQKVFQTIDGKPSSLTSSDKIDLIYVFAPWCQVCELSASNINDLADEAIAVKALALSWSSRQAVSDFLSASDLVSTVLLGDDDDASALGINVFPSYLILNPKGDVLLSWSGYTSKLGLWARLTWARWWSNA